MLKALQGKKEVDTGHSVFFLKITSQLKKKKKKSGDTNTVKFYPSSCLNWNKYILNCLVVILVYISIIFLTNAPPVMEKLSA